MIITRKKSRMFTTILMLLISVIALSSATYAWYVMITTVEASNIQVTAAVPTELEIKKTGTDWPTSDKHEVTWTNATLGRLWPASTPDGLAANFFIATKVGATGASEVPDEGTRFTSINAFSDGPVTATADGYYYDVPLSIRTIGSSDVNLALNINAGQTEVTGADGKTLHQAVRIAILDKDGAVIDDSANFKYIYSSDKATGATGIALPVAATDSTLAAIDGKIITDTTNATTIFTVPAAPTDGSANDGIDIIARIWIEGEHASAIKDNAGVTLTTKLVFTNADASGGVAIPSGVEKTVVPEP